jgi:hypothetical protein
MEPSQTARTPSTPDLEPDLSNGAADSPHRGGQGFKSLDERCPGRRCKDGIWLTTTTGLASTIGPTERAPASSALTGIALMDQEFLAAWQGALVLLAHGLLLALVGTRLAVSRDVT